MLWADDLLITYSPGVSRAGTLSILPPAAFLATLSLSFLLACNPSVAFAPRVANPVSMSFGSSSDIILSS